MIPLCKHLGVGLIPWSPLARGFLAGNRGKDDKARGDTSRAATDDIAQNYYYRDSDFKVLAALTQVAQARGVQNATVAYAWLLAKGVAAPIVGSSKTAQIDAAVQASALTLSADEIKLLEVAYEPHPIIGHS
jgi:aryl-alcohol dehydrogenase (NADP+)